MAATGGYLGRLEYPTTKEVLVDLRVVGDTHSRVIIGPLGVQVGDGTVAPTFGETQFDIITGADVTIASASLVASTLTVPVAASTYYRVDFALEIVTPEADDFLFLVAGPTSATGRFSATGLAVAATAVTGDVNKLPIVLGTNYTIGSEDTGPVTVDGTGWILTDTTAGSLTITVAKAADNGADGTVEIGSWLEARKVRAV
jgi:hypothetical protein